MNISLTGAAGAATGFARTVPMKGRASRGRADPQGRPQPSKALPCERLARVRVSKSDSLARRADSRRFAVGFFFCVHMNPIHEIEVQLISMSVFLGRDHNTA